jgi:hypothetical protein
VALIPIVDKGNPVIRVGKDQAHEVGRFGVR